MKVCSIDLGQVGLGWDGLGCNIALRWGTVFGSFQLLKAKICVKSKNLYCQVVKF